MQGNELQHFMSKPSQPSAYTTGKSGAAVQHIIAVRHRTAKNSLPCAAIGTHGKEYVHGKVTGWRTAKIKSTATSPMPHGNVPSHGKVPQTRTAKKP
jgi:hypothetical protein